MQVTGHNNKACNAWPFDFSNQTIGIQGHSCWLLSNRGSHPLQVKVMKMMPSLPVVVFYRHLYK
jgi:hypothetical protein